VVRRSRGARIRPSAKSKLNFDRSIGLLFRTFDPRHSSRLALRLRSTRKRQGGRQKDRAVRAVSGVCPGSVLVPLDYPTWLDELLRRLGATLAPIALVSVGYQLQLSLVSGRGLALTVGLLFKLVIAPALILLLFVRWLSGDGQVLNVTVFEAAMAPMIGASIVAIDHELNPPLVTLMVGLGIQLSFVTLPVWWRLLGTM
jgi:hypothetical protein